MTKEKTEALLPGGYHPYANLTFCSNQLRRVKVPVLFDSTPVLLVGHSPFGPKIWLYAPVAPQSAEWILAVSANRSLKPSVRVQLDPRGKRVIVSIDGAVVLDVREVSMSHAIVARVDLNPVGLALSGGLTGLQFGGTTMAHNIISGAFAGFAISSSVAPTTTADR